MSGAHTPGPWRWEGSALRAGSRLKPLELEIVLWGDNTIGDSANWSERIGACGTSTEAAAEANARLIAAAPDLLSALQALVNAADNLDPQSGVPAGYQQLLDAAIVADAAIAKATGGAA